MSLGQHQVEKIILAEPRGFCAGVDRAVEAVRGALRTYGRPLYVRHQIVHNRFVLEALEEEGAIFVEDLGEVPQGQRVIFSAHGVAPSEWDRARATGDCASSTPPARWSPRCISRSSVTRARTAP